jgi:gluconolactonase
MLRTMNRWLVMLLWLSAGVAMSRSEDATREVKIDDVTLVIPTTWKQEKPSSNLRLGQFAIPAVEGDKEPAELAIFNFGAGGGVQANIDRWVGQFLPENRQSKTTQGKSPQGEYYFVDVSGTYKKPVGPPIQGKTESVPGSRMLGVILAVEKKGLYFLKLTGPEKTVAAAATPFRTAIGGKMQDEKPYEPGA